MALLRVRKNLNMLIEPSRTVFSKVSTTKSYLLAGMNMSLATFDACETLTTASFLTSGWSFSQTVSGAGAPSMGTSRTSCWFTCNVPKFKFCLFPICCTYNMSAQRGDDYLSKLYSISRGYVIACITEVSGKFFCLPSGHL